MHDARLKQRFYMHSDFTSIRIVPMHGFMKKSDYSCTVTMHVHKIKKDKDLTFSLNLSTGRSMHGSVRTEKLGENNPANAECRELALPAMR